MSRYGFSCVAVVAVFLAGAVASAQPKLPKETIPQDLPSEIRSLLEQCYASEASARGSAARTRGEAAKNLGQLKEKAGPAVPFLISMLGDDESYADSIRAGQMIIHGTSSPGRRAAVALGSIGSAAVEPLLKVLEAAKGSDRNNAALALGIAKDPRAVPPLIEALAGQDARLRSEAATALGRLKDTRAVAPLIGALSDPDEAVSRAAREALEELTAQKFGKDQARWQEWWQANKKQ
jgi:HEAT repeat protein